MHLTGDLGNTNLASTDDLGLYRGPSLEVLFSSGVDRMRLRYSRILQAVHYQCHLMNMPSHGGAASSPSVPRQHHHEYRVLRIRTHLLHHLSFSRVTTWATRVTQVLLAASRCMVSSICNIFRTMTWSCP